MKIHFFEEFPEPSQLETARGLPKGTRVYLAARGKTPFLEARQRLLDVEDGLEVAYWPLLPASYWVSAFACPEDLQHLEDELSSWPEAVGAPVMLDLELPLLRPGAFVRYGHQFRRNQRRIKHLMQGLAAAGVEVLTAEYPAPSRSLWWMLEKAGISFSFAEVPHRKIVMYYTSILRSPWLLRQVQKQLERLAEEWGERLCVGIGCLETGIFGNEPILTPQELERDLRFVRSLGIEEAVLFRLGGLRGSLRDVVERYL
jgi:hypothetical protein